jgi:hypothetical protein
MRIPMSYAARAAAILLLTAPLAATATSRAEDPAPARCCFQNPRFAGTCEVQPGKDESCSQILDYLNNPMSKGRTYCNNTDVRGGWTSVACEAKK